jgi:hypothetical protein
MPELQHTPGPWSVGRSDMGYLAVVPPGHGSTRPDGVLYLPVPICRVGTGYGRGEGEALANARLIAVAPELHAVARELLECWDHGTPVHPGAEAVAALRAAVARAAAVSS